MEDVVVRMKKIWCCKGAEFARPELQDGWVEIKRLRAEVAEANKRVEELEQRWEIAERELPTEPAAIVKDVWDIFHSFLKEKNLHFITTEQIDAAWEYVQNILFATKGNADFKRFAKEIFERIGVVACEECGGEGVVDNNRMKPVSCESCGGHRWKVVNDE